MFKKPSTSLLIAGVGGALVLAVLLWQVMSRGQGVSPTQEPKKIGVLQVFAVTDRLYTGLKQGMEELGYEEGKDVVYEYRNWNQDLATLAVMTQELLGEDVDVIYALSNASIGSALEATKEKGLDTPIVFALASDPKGAGLVQDYASSGNNATGVADNLPRNAAKQLEFLLQMNPNAKRIGVFTNGFMHPPAPLVLAALKAEAPRLGIEMVEYTTTVQPGPALVQEFERIAQTIQQGDVDAIFHLPGHHIVDQNVREVALGRRLKVINGMPIWEELEGGGGTFAYSGDMFDMGKQAATLVDKILKGAKPSDIPVEFPRKDELSLNLENARAIGITIPSSMLSIAEKVIE